MNKKTKSYHLDFPPKNIEKGFFLSTTMTIIADTDTIFTQLSFMTNINFKNKKCSKIEQKLGIKNRCVKLPNCTTIES